MDEVVYEVEVIDPVKVGSGRFSLYVAPGERVVVAMQLDGQEETHRWVVPKMLLRALGRSSGVDLIAMLRSISAED